MEPKDAIIRAESIFDDMMAEAIEQFEKASEAETWEEALESLRGIAGVVRIGSAALAGYADVAARQINRREA